MHLLISRSAGKQTESATPCMHWASQRSRLPPEGGRGSLGHGTLLERSKAVRLTRGPPLARTNPAAAACHTVGLPSSRTTLAAKRAIINPTQNPNPPLELLGINAQRLRNNMKMTGMLMLRLGDDWKSRSLPIWPHSLARNRRRRRLAGAGTAALRLLGCN